VVMKSRKTLRARAWGMSQKGGTPSAAAHSALFLRYVAQSGWSGMARAIGSRGI